LTVENRARQFFSFIKRLVLVKFRVRTFHVIGWRGGMVYRRWSMSRLSHKRTLLLDKEARKEKEKKKEKKKERQSRISRLSLFLLK
jgi:uncharacterized membrane protein